MPASIPQPAIVMNRDILEQAPPALRQLYELCGALPVDTAIFPSPGGVRYNQTAIKKARQQFITQGKHLMIFPEGTRLIFGWLTNQQQKSDLEQRIDRFHPGIIEMILLLLRKKPNIQVIPVGLHHEKGIGSIYLKPPLCISFVNKEILLNGQPLSLSHHSILTEMAQHAPNSQADAFIYNHHNPSVQAIGLALCTALTQSKAAAREAIQNITPDTVDFRQLPVLGKPDPDNHAGKAD